MEGPPISKKGEHKNNNPYMGVHIREFQETYKPANQNIWKLEFINNITTVFQLILSFNDKMEKANNRP